MRPDFNRLDVLRGYYYLAPAWLALETLLWPGIRAGLIAGDSGFGRAGFYAVEAAIGAGFWMGARWAGPAAFLENVGYLVLACKFVVLGPIDIALQADLVDIGPAGDRYALALPGVLCSLALVVIQIYRQGYLRERES